MKIIHFVIFVFLFAAAAGCLYRKAGVNKLNGWNGIEAFANKKIGIGHFNVNARSSEIKKMILYDSLYFNLQKSGFDPVEHLEMKKLYEKMSLPPDRILVEYELFKLSEQFGGEYILQGSFYETGNEDILNEKYTLSLNCYLSDALTGKKAASFKIVRANLKNVSDSEIFSMTRKLARMLEK